MDNKSFSFGHKYSLKEYFIKYLLEICGLKNSSVKHYVDALDSTISNFLVSKGLIKESIFEITWVIMPFEYTDEKENSLYAWRAFSYGKKIEIFC